MTSDGLELARRLEIAEAVHGAACAGAHQQLNPETGAAVIEVGGGVAIFVGAESPLTHAVGLGMRGAVSADDIDGMEEFFLSRGATVMVELCPLADASLADLLERRGYRVADLNNVLVRPLDGGAFAPEELVRLAGPDEEYLWARTVGRGFLEKDELSPEELGIGLTIWRMPGARCFLAFAGGRAGAAASMAVHDDLATLFADSTLMGFRGGGLQGALIRERLRVAQQDGCDMATATTAPESVSQRNYERHGFQVAYTKSILTLQCMGLSE